jgi:predicted transposase YbfD/YdcC
MASRESATSVNKGHGRVERRTLTCTPLLNDYLRQQGWPDVGQVFRIQRQRQIGSKTSAEVAYGITSLTPEQADATALSLLARGHWKIENSLHHVRDVTLGEDACRVRTGSAPQALAALRNLVLNLLAPMKNQSKASALRRFAAKPREAIRLLAQPPEN